MAVRLERRVYRWLGWALLTLGGGILLGLAARPSAVAARLQLLGFRVDAAPFGGALEIAIVAAALAAAGIAILSATYVTATKTDGDD